MNYEQLESEKYISLETYKKNNESIKTPVCFVIKNDLIFIVTGNETGKIKRLKNNQNVKIATCTFKGKIKSEWFEGTAKILTETETKEIVKQQDKRYGIMSKIVRFFSKNMGKVTAFSISITN
jgi:PPOX class probable F420-dependent enzyme